MRHKTISQMTDDELDALHDKLDLVRGLLKSLQAHPENIADRVARALEVIDG